MASRCHPTPPPPTNHRPRVVHGAGRGVAGWAGAARRDGRVIRHASTLGSNHDTSYSLGLCLVGFLHESSAEWAALDE